MFKQKMSIGYKNNNLKDVFSENKSNFKIIYFENV